MDKLDLTKAYKAHYTASRSPEKVELGAASYLAIRGKGDPSGPVFAECLQALYAVAYVIKFDCKQEGKDFVVPKLEAQWWFDTELYPGLGVAEAPQQVPRSEWEFRLLIRMPDFVRTEQVEVAIEAVVQKKGLPLAQAVSQYEIAAGTWIQMLHLGPFDREPESLAQMVAWMEGKGFKKAGDHHEIYLSDFRSTAPEKLKTILREPVE